jgi:hypothetical protein
MEHFSSPSRRPEPQRTASYGGRAAAGMQTESRRQGSGLGASEEADLSDLYVKIDIPENGLGAMAISSEDDFSPQDIALASSFPAHKDILVMDEDDEVPDSILPDLDGDMSFSLEDPLESNEPAVSFAGNLADARKKAKDFNPDESPL